MDPVTGLRNLPALPQSGRRPLHVSGMPLLFCPLAAKLDVGSHWLSSFLDITRTATLPMYEDGMDLSQRQVELCTSNKSSGTAQSCPHA